MAEKNYVTKDGVNETDLSGHKQSKKELIPPLNQIGMTTSSWIDHRMPEMIWAVLAIGNLERAKALDFFRHIGAYSREHNECWDVTMSGIAALLPEHRKNFLKAMVDYSPEIKELLKSLLVFPELPALQDWKEALGVENTEKFTDEELSAFASNLGTAIKETMWHQSDPATDCRWVKVLCRVEAGKVKFHSKIDGIEERVKGLLNYPNYGDLTHIRPFIRASEIGPTNLDNGDDPSWPNHFWNFCYTKTACLSKGDDAASSTLKEKMESWDKQKEHYYDETVRLRMSLIDHFYKTSTTSDADAKHQAVFGLALYAHTILIEIVMFRMTYTISARLSLRAIVEAYITLAYLIKKDDPETWESFRKYGSGQAKLAYLKIKDMKPQPASISEETLRRIANEDSWQEFVNINLGHWDTTTLREMADEAGLKEVYDTYFTYTSGFVHANWAAIRESAYEMCYNPLHRMHTNPTVELPMLPSVIEDASLLVNKVFELVDTTYPSFTDKIKPFTETITQEPAL